MTSQTLVQSALPTSAENAPLHRRAAAEAPVRGLLIGSGGMARHHLRNIVRNPRHSVITAIVEPSLASYDAAAEIFLEAGLTPPPRVETLTSFLAGGRSTVDAAFIITPHLLHHDQAVACLEAGIDVLLEKPMVMNRAEALSLTQTQERSGRTLVVAFNGSLSPRIRTAARLVRSGALGEVVSISATVWQSWKPNTRGSWRQDPVQSGGGFLFDTGAHMLNTVCDLAGEPFAEVSARLDNRGAPVDIVGVVWGRLQSGAWVTMHASGDTAPRRGAMGSDVRVMCTQGVLRTGIWGERLAVQGAEDTVERSIRTGPQASAWETFLRIRSGKMANPAPPLLGIRMACLWDAIQASSAAGGKVVAVDNLELQTEAGTAQESPQSGG